MAPDTMAHLFDCLKQPTHLIVRDLRDQLILYTVKLLNAGYQINAGLK